jgi:hypothetical protein
MLWVVMLALLVTSAGAVMSGAMEGAGSAMSAVLVSGLILTGAAPMTVLDEGGGAKERKPRRRHHPLLPLLPLQPARK